MPEVRAQSQAFKRRPEADLLLCCARTQLTPEIADRIRTLVDAGINWIVLIQLAMRHDVMPFLCRSLEQVCPDATPEYISKPLRTRYETQRAQALRYAQELVRITQRFTSSGIEVIPYKGPALAQRLYGDLALREFGDLDIVIHRRDVLRAHDLILDAGFECFSIEKPENLAEYVRSSLDCELRYRRSNGPVLEMHWRFASRSACVRRDPERFLQRCETIWLADAKVSSLPLETYLLVLSLHATKHKWQQLKLICDLAEILGRPDLDWSYVAREAHASGLMRMLVVGVLLAEDPLGATIPAALLRELKLDSAARAIADRIRGGFFEEHDEHEWHQPADFHFQHEIRERPWDSVAMSCQNFLEKLAPTERDRMFLPMPRCLSSMYSLLRPLRWTLQKINVIETPTRQTNESRANDREVYE